MGNKQSQRGRLLQRKVIKLTKIKQQTDSLERVLENVIKVLAKVNERTIELHNRVLTLEANQTELTNKVKNNE